MAILRVGDGSDGNVTITSNKNMNTSIMAGGRSYADGVFFRVNVIGANYVTASATPNGIESGDQVIIINLNGRSGNRTNAGNYEIFTVDYISSSDVYFTQPINKLYGDNGGNGNITSHPVMIQRVPQYENFTINSGAILSATSCVTATHNTIGGLVILKCSDTLNITNGYINTNYSGFQAPTTWPKLINGQHGWGRGGGAGAPVSGTDRWGAGGGHGTAGGNATAGAGGAAYGVADLSNMEHGSGGGRACSGGWYAADGDGGGSIFVIAQTITISTGGITSNGNAYDAYSTQGGVMNGGGGSGGSVLIHAGSVTIPSSSLSVTGGPGYVSAGAGGVGRIAIHYQSGTVGSISPTPYTDTIELPYKISGTIVGGPAQFLRIYDPTTGELLNTYSDIENGAYEVDAPGAGPYDVIARKSNDHMLIYGGVVPAEI